LILGQIQNKVFRPGDKLPSVRELHSQLGVSITTVLNAYAKLEDEGWIGAEPKSGFYVRLRTGQSRLTAPPKVPGLAPSDPLMLTVLRDLCNQNAVQMATANPNNEALPIAALNRISRAITAEYPEESINYAPVEGLPALREQIGRRMISAGCAMHPDQILITAGCGEALSLALRVVCRPGDVIAIESPAYYALLQQLRAMDLQVLEVATSETQGMCLDELEAILCEHNVSAVLATPNFNNPLGAMMPDEKKRRLVELLAEHEVPLIEDDVYGELPFSDERPSVCKAFDTKGLVIYCSSFSKVLAPGYRVGWISGGRFHDELVLQKFGASCSSVSLQQMVIAEYLQSHRFSKTMEKAISLNQKNMDEAIKEIHDTFPEGTRIVKPQGGFVLWVQMPENCDSVELYRRASQEGILFVPGPAFTTHGLYQNCLRLNVSRTDARVVRAIRRLGELAHSL